MIKLSKLNKYYNKNRANENHVVKDISISLPDKGLVVILGTSGSGKTTLLNLMSGMDKPYSGSIDFGEETFIKYRSKDWDSIRNHEIGYIFQNYHLLKDLSVYENIELVLKMSGIRDLQEIQKRIQYLLDKVGMQNYEDRRADQLSGGQQQRVAFARALANNPKVIIADEPTGNLDSRTTVEIMNIIKEISKQKLVVMVTHETELADFYADRIIEVANGIIVNDHINEYQGDLSILREHVIYLKDYERDNISSKTAAVTTYQKDTAKEDQPVDITLIKRHDSLYVKVDSKEYPNVKFIDNDSEIELVNKHQDDEKYVASTTFDFNDFIDDSQDPSSSVVTWRDSFKYALRKINKLNYGGKLLYFVLGLVGAVIAVSIGLLGNIYYVNDASFVTKQRNYIEIYLRNIEYEDVLAFEELDYIEEIQFIEEPITFNIDTEWYYEITSSIELDAHPTNIELLNESSIIYGSYPSDVTEVVIDQSLADQLIKDYQHRGINNYDDIISLNIKILASGQDYNVSEETSLLMPIVGIAADNSPTMWMSKGLMYSVAIPTLCDYKLLGDGFEMTSGTMPDGYKQILLSEKSSLIRPIGVPIDVGIQTGRYDVVGTYTYTVNNTEYDSGYLMMTTEDHLEKDYFYNKDFAFTNFSFLAYTNDPAYAVEQLQLLGIDATSEYQDDYDQYVEFRFDDNIALYIFSIVGISASAISIFFIMRSSLLSRIYEVSVYRALGARKREIRKMFIVEIMVTTTISSIIGFFVMIALLLQAQSQVVDYVQIVHYGVLSYLGGILGIYFINILFGLLPINMLLLKTPTAILTKYDL